MTDLARYRRLVASVAARTVPLRDQDDAIQDGMVAVWQAIDSFDGTGSLTGWLNNKIRWAIIDGQRVRTGYKRYGRVDVLHFDGFDPQANRLDDPEARAVTADQVRWVRTKLSPADVALFDGLLEGRTQQSIADEQGVTLSRVCQRVAKIRQLLNN